MHIKYNFFYVDIQSIIGIIVYSYQLHIYLSSTITACNIIVGTKFILLNDIDFQIVIVYLLQYL